MILHHHNLHQHHQVESNNYCLYLFVIIVLKGNTEMRFGGLISTSNLVKEEKITVESDSDLLWTISIKKTGLPVENNTP